MSKFLFALLVVGVGLLYHLGIDHVFSKPSYYINTVKSSLFVHFEKVYNGMNNFIDQAHTIEELRQKQEDIIPYQQSLLNLQYQFDRIKDHTPLPTIDTGTIQLVRVLSYVDFNDFYRVWLDLSKWDQQIWGLMDGEYSAGIVIQKGDSQAQALLNGHEKSNYAVFVGNQKAPGIVHQHTKGLLSIKYIPIWMTINIGDEVITSGMDNIFFEGLKVGKVVEIKTMQDQQEAYIKPYANILKKRYFYLYQPKKTDFSELDIQEVNQ